MPRHVGNETANSAAKSALDLPQVKVNYTDFKQHVSQYILYIRQNDWNVSFCQDSPWRLAVFLQDTTTVQPI